MVQPSPMVSQHTIIACARPFLNLKISNASRSQRTSTFRILPTDTLSRALKSPYYAQTAVPQVQVAESKSTQTLKIPFQRCGTQFTTCPMIFAIHAKKKRNQNRSIAADMRSSEYLRWRAFGWLFSFSG